MPSDAEADRLHRNVGLPLDEMEVFLSRVVVDTRTALRKARKTVSGDAGRPKHATFPIERRLPIALCTHRGVLLACAIIRDH